jgi:hypothetical protein
MTTIGAQPTEELEAMDTQPMRHDNDEWEWKRQRAHQTHQLNSIALETTRELPAITEIGERRVPKTRPASSWTFASLDRLAKVVTGLSIYKRRT